ncbi:MAG: T9SS type A sorting domain-containing protein, partial [FCB group bacterium]
LDTAWKISISINFAPQSTGIFSDSLIIISNNPCPRKWAIPINGMSNAESIVSLPDTSAIIGLKDFCVPLRLKLNCREITSATPMPYIATIYFNADIFYATSITNGTLEVNNISNNIQTIKIRDDNYILQSNDTILTEICGMILLGSAYSTTLTISDFSFQDTLVSVVKKNGSINVTGICQPDLRRITFGPLLTMSLSPNPVTDVLNIDIENVEKGNYTLKIFDVLGTTLFSNNFSIYDETVKNKIITLNTNAFAQGIYILTLQTPMRYLTAKFMILR